MYLAISSNRKILNKRNIIFDYNFIYLKLYKTHYTIKYNINANIKLKYLSISI